MPKKKSKKDAKSEAALMEAESTYAAAKYKIEKDAAKRKGSRGVGVQSKKKQQKDAKSDVALGKALTQGEELSRLKKKTKKKGKKTPPALNPWHW